MHLNDHIMLLFLQINKDETLTLVFGIHTAGKTMYGLAAYLTGENVSEPLPQYLKSMCDMLS